MHLLPSAQTKKEAELFARVSGLDNTLRHCTELGKLYQNKNADMIINF